MAFELNVGSSLHSMVANGVMEIGRDVSDIYTAIQFWRNQPVNSNNLIDIYWTGVIDCNKSIILDLRNASSFRLLGAQDSRGTPTAATISTVGAGNHVITMTKAAHDLRVGQWVEISLTGTGPVRCLEGLWQVATVPDANTFTYVSTAQNATLDAVVISAGSVTRKQSVIRASGSDMRAGSPYTDFNPYASDPGVLDIRSNGTRVENVAIDMSACTDSDAIGVIARAANMVNMQQLSVHGSPKAGFWFLFSSYGYGKNIMAVNCGRITSSQGIVTQLSGSLNFDTVVASCNASSGVRGRDGGGAVFQGLKAGGNGSGGLTGEGWCQLFAPSCNIGYNVQPTGSLGDVRAEGPGAKIAITDGTVVSDQAAYCVQAKGDGVVYVDGATLTHLSGTAGKAAKQINGGKIVWEGSAPTVNITGSAVDLVVASHGGTHDTTFYGTVDVIP